MSKARCLKNFQDFPGLFLSESKTHRDFRGEFRKVLEKNTSSEESLDFHVSEVNFSRTVTAGTIRGFHFQYPPFTETKVVSCLKGSIMDVVIDIRPESPTYLAYFKTILSSENLHTLWIPKGFAHAFQSLSEDCEVLYFVDTPFKKDSQGNIHPLDHDINVNWPLNGDSMSAQDSNSPGLMELILSEKFKTLAKW